MVDALFVGGFEAKLLLSVQKFRTDLVKLENVGDKLDKDLGSLK